jgi:hypothetical protein
MGDSRCQLPPSYVVSINTQNGEYMIGVVCKEHMGEIEKQLKTLQVSTKLPRGNIKFEPIKVVMTDCIKGGDEDYIGFDLQEQLYTG